VLPRRVGFEGGRAGSSSRADAAREVAAMGAGGTLNPMGGHAEKMPGFEAHYLEVDGTTIGFETMEQAADFTPLYKGLPGDLCQSHHWGYVIGGRMVFHRPEGDLVANAGEAYYVAPGHTGEAAVAGTKVVEFSPTPELNATMEVLSQNLAAPH
jgi:hypothetical protein